MIPLDPHAAVIRHQRDIITMIGRAIGCPAHGQDEILAYALKHGHKGMYYTVEWSETLCLWVGLCSDYPELSHCDITPAKALEGIRALVPEPVELDEAA